MMEFLVLFFLFEAVFALGLDAWRIWKHGTSGQFFPE